MKQKKIEKRRAIFQAAVRVNWLQSLEFAFRDDLKGKHEDFFVKPDMSVSSPCHHRGPNRESEINNNCTYAGAKIQWFIKWNCLKLAADLVSTRQITVTYETPATQAYAARCSRGVCSRFYRCLCRGSNKYPINSCINELKVSYWTHLPLDVSNRYRTFI